MSQLTATRALKKYNKEWGIDSIALIIEDYFLMVSQN